MAGKSLASKTGQVNYNVPGATGPIGPLVYPAGEYNAATKYIRTALSAPMVLDDGQYYVLNKEGTFTGIRPKDDYAANGSKATWVLMEYVKYAFVEVLMANFAKLGSAVFYGDVMMSQQGIDADGNESSSYQNYGKKRYDPNTGQSADLFTPNILFNFLTGAGHLGRKNIVFGSDGSINVSSNITAQSLKLKVIKSGDKLSTGCFINNAGTYIADELKAGEVCIVRWALELATRLPAMVTITAQNSNVQLQDGTVINTHSELEFDIIGTSGLIYGIGGDTSTKWIVFKMNVQQI